MVAVLDVLIIGAGPTGLMMAAEVSRHGLTCRIIDKEKGPCEKSKAIAIQARTLEVFDHIGISPAFLAEGLKVRAANPISRKSPITHISFESLDSPFPFILAIEQSKTEKILGDHVLSFGVKVERQTELKSLHQTHTGVDATLYHTPSGKEEKITASWVIGCDGAHSLARKTCNLPFEGRSFADVFSLADVYIHWHYPHDELFGFLDSKGVMAAIPLPGKNRYRLIFQLKRCRKFFQKKHFFLSKKFAAETLADPSIEETEAMLDKYVGKNIKISHPTWMANFHINSRMVKNYRKGKIFLAGDAAHIHSPIGGQGMNTGIQDAFNLAWKLALVLKKKANMDLLDTYQEERHHVGKILLRGTEIASFMATLRNPIAITLRNFVMSCFSRFKIVRKRLMTMVSQTGIKYPKSFITIEKSPFYTGPKAGMRAPNAPFKEQNTDFYSLWRKTTSHHVLIFSGSNPSQKHLIPLLKIAHDITANYASMATPMVIFHPDCTPKNISSGNTHMDIGGKAHAIYGCKNASVYVIRPDGYIGYRDMNLEDFAVEDYFKTLLD